MKKEYDLSKIKRRRNPCLINLYLRDCMQSHRKLQLKWRTAESR